MIYFTILLLVFCFIAGALTHHAIKSGGNRLALVMIFCGLVVFVVTAAIDLLGLPKPKALEIRPLDGAPVVGLHIDGKTETVYVWALRDGIPVTYTFPWKSEEAAEDLEREFYEQEADGTQLQLSDDDSNYRFRGSLLPETK